jgi:hypothetical protein
MGKDKRIRVTFDKDEKWKFVFKNKDVFYDWVDLLKLAGCN